MRYSTHFIESIENWIVVDNFSYTFTDSSILTADLSSNHLVLSSIADISGDTELMITATNHWMFRLKNST